LEEGPNKTLIGGWGVDFYTAFHIFGKLGTKQSQSFGLKTQTPDIPYARSSHPSLNAK
jgi:hypothetical protein